MKRSWSFLTRHIFAGRASVDLSRTDSMQNRYERHKAYLARHGYTQSRFVMEFYLKDRHTVLIRNHFPYDLDRNITHYVLFADEPLEPAEIDSMLRDIFDDQSVLWYVNEPAIQSIKDLWHCQVFHLPPSTSLTAV